MKIESGIKHIKLKDFLLCCGYNSADVRDDYNSDWIIAYCGNGLTPEGEKRYQQLLDLDVEWNPEAQTACVLIKYRTDAEQLDKKLEELFFWNAGFCSDSEWEKLFLSEPEGHA